MRRTISATQPPAALLPRHSQSPYLENKCSFLSLPSEADLPRPFQRTAQKQSFHRAST